LPKSALEDSRAIFETNGFGALRLKLAGQNNQVLEQRLARPRRGSYRLA
jgi:hypothetical protein